MQKEPSHKIIEDQDQDDRIHDRLGDRPPDATRTSDGDHSLMTTNRPNDNSKDGTLQEAVQNIAQVDNHLQVHKE